jgi:hypothetical protein
LPAGPKTPIQVVTKGVSTKHNPQNQLCVALIVHRGQGSTTERAHLFADGGGRELAYVALSRARQSTHVWAVADDLPQAVDDLRRDWSTPRTPTWAIDTALPNPATLTRERFQTLPPDQQAGFAALLHAETSIAGDAIASIRVPNRADTLGHAEAALAQAQQARNDLETGSGLWQTTEAGRAVRDLAHARHERQQAEWAGDHGDRWRDRHRARKEAAMWGQREIDAQKQWETRVAPAINHLDQAVALHRACLDRGAEHFEHRQAMCRAVIDHGLEQQRHAMNLGRRVDANRDHLDGLPSPAEMRQAAMRTEQLHDLAALQHQPSPSRSPGIEI